MLAFVVILRTIGVPSPVPDVVLGAGLHPSNAYASVDADVSGLVWDALLSVEGGLPDDVLLSIPEGIMLTRDGVAAVTHNHWCKSDDHIRSVCGSTLKLV